MTTITTIAREAIAADEGPRVEMTCCGCRHYKQVPYRAQGDSGYDKSCAYPSTPREMDEFGGTPQWCVFRRTALLDALSTLKEPDRE